MLDAPSENKFEALRYRLQKAYNDDPVYKGKFIVAQLVFHQATADTDVLGTIKNYFFGIAEKDVLEIQGMLSGRRLS